MSIEQIGVISVDAGLVMVGDPCYILHTQQTPKAVGKNWSEFCETLEGKKRLQLDHDAGYTGLAVVEGNFGGDGLYPVFVEKDEQGITTKLTVKFN